MPTQRLTRRGILLVAALAGFTACLSPTLPLPPPSRPEIEGPDEAGFVTLSGNVTPHAEAIAYNSRTRDIVGEETLDDGAYELRMEAQVGDEISFRYREGNRDSPSVVVTVKTAP